MPTPVEAIVLDAAVRRYGGSVEAVLIRCVQGDDETTIVDAVVRLRPVARWVTVKIVAGEG
jgi:hypothetical protein